MEAAPLPAPHATPAAPAAPRADDWDWVYEDPDLAPFRAGAARRKRPEVPLTAFA